MIFILYIIISIIFLRRVINTTMPSVFTKFVSRADHISSNRPLYFYFPVKYCSFNIPKDNELDDWTFMGEENNINIYIKNEVWTMIEEYHMKSPLYMRRGCKFVISKNIHTPIITTNPRLGGEDYEFFYEIPIGECGRCTYDFNMTNYVLNILPIEIPQTKESIASNLKAFNSSNMDKIRHYDTISYNVMKEAYEKNIVIDYILNRGLLDKLHSEEVIQRIIDSDGTVKYKK